MIEKSSQATVWLEFNMWSLTDVDNVPLTRLPVLGDTPWCSVKDSFDFTKDITQQSSKLFMASLDVDSLFTNGPLDETIEICVNKLFKSSQTVSGINKQQVLEMLSLTTKENVILFDEKYYSQIDGVAMGQLSLTFFYVITRQRG